MDVAEERSECGIYIMQQTRRPPGVLLGYVLTSPCIKSPSHVPARAIPGLARARKKRERVHLGVGFFSAQRSNKFKEVEPLFRAKASRGFTDDHNLH